MKSLALAFIDLVAHMEIANFDDPDEEQGAREVVSRFLSEASQEERAIVCQATSHRIAELRTDGAPAAAIEFYETFAAKVTPTTRLFSENALRPEVRALCAAFVSAHHLQSHSRPFSQIRPRA
jgi:hypothetical protein